MARNTPTVIESVTLLFVALLALLSAFARFLHNVIVESLEERDLPTLPPETDVPSELAPDNEGATAIGRCDPSRPSSSESPSTSEPVNRPMPSMAEILAMIDNTGGDPPRKYYAVARGRSIGIFTSWEVVEPLVNGFPHARHRSFRNRIDAEIYLAHELARLRRMG